MFTLHYQYSIEDKMRQVDLTNIVISACEHGEYQVYADVYE